MIINPSAFVKTVGALLGSLSPLIPGRGVVPVSNSFPPPP